MEYTRVNIIFPNTVSKTQGVPLISAHPVLEVQSEIILILSFFSFIFLINYGSILIFFKFEIP